MTTTEHITVLFTDLVGSTELQSSLAPEAADEVRHRHFSALRQAIASCGGTEVKNLGDGVMVVFPAASSALGCAVTMQQIVHRDNAGAERQLGLRVGLSSGEATKEGDDFFGDPVIEAARLCAKAGSGQILASEVVKISAGRRSSHTFTPLGELELKGLPDPVETLEVAWVPLGDDVPASGSVPLPVRLSHVPGVGVIGRQDELAALNSAAKRVGSGEGRELIFLAGEPGQGKTTLVSEFARRSHETHVTVLLGRCDEDIGAPYQPFHEALTHFVTHADEAILRSHVATHGGELDRLVPALRQRLGDLPAPQSTDPDTERYLLYGAVVGLLEAAAEEFPVLLVLDDLHWADKPSLQLLRHLVARTSTLRLLIVGTHRDAELSSAHPLEEALAAFHREPAGISTVAVKGLDDTGVIAYMEAAAGHELDDAGVGLAHQLYRETDGNPFYVSEVLRHLSESGAIYQDAASDCWMVDQREQLDLPNSVRSVIGTRVSRLGEAATKVLSTAAVIGRDFDLDLLAETTGVEEDVLLDLLDEAQRAALVVELTEFPDRYSFTHALVQHTLYEDISPARRTRAHRQVGEAIERLHANEPDDFVGELARHFILATKPTDATKAITYAQRAGNAALKALAPDDAVRYLTQALELAALGNAIDEKTRIDLLISCGTAQQQAGSAEYGTTLLEACRSAQAIGDTDRLVVAALANNRGFFSSLGVVDTERVAMLEAAIEALPETDSSQRALLLARLCNELAFGPLERRLELGQQAKAMALRVGDDPTLVRVLTDLANPLRIPSALDESIGDAREAVRIANRMGDPYFECLAAGQAVTQAIRAGDFDLSDQQLAHFRALVDATHQPVMQWMSLFNGGQNAILHGDPMLAEELATRALGVGTASGQPDALSFYGTQLMAIRRQQGRSQELVPLIAQIAEDHPTVPTYRAVLAGASFDAGDHAAATKLVEAAAAQSFDLPMDAAWLDGVIGYARPTIELSLAPAALQIYNLLKPYRAQICCQGLTVHEPVAMFLGGLSTVLGHFDEAESYFEQADELQNRGGMRFAEAHTKMLWGRMLRLRGGPGDTDRAQDLLTEARQASSSRGYAAIEQRAIAELSKLG